MFAGLIALLVAPAVVSATSLEYYRSAYCHARGTGFLLERTSASESPFNEKACHQAPARTMGMRLIDGLNPACVVLAYDDYACTSLVGSIPSNGKCIGATKAKIGSWRVQCNTASKTEIATSTSAPYIPGDLKRRNKMRMASIDQVHNVTATPYTSHSTIDATVVASSVASEISSAVNASATNDVAAKTTSSPSAGAALSSAIISGTAIEYNLTAYATAGPNSTYTTSIPTSATTFSTVTYTGTRGGNGTVLLHVGGSSSNQIDGASILITLLCGVLAVAGAVTL